MPLREHLRELRSRLLKAGIAIALGGVVGWLVYDRLLLELTAPLDRIQAERGILAKINFGQVAASFNIKLKIAVYLGIVVSSPVWLYQIWAFVVPGLTRKERRTSMGFVGVAVPLFLSGVWVGWRVLPNAINFLTDFIPKNGASLIDAETYLTFVTRLLLAFGIAFVLPLFLVALNLAGVVSALTLAKGWRIAVFLVFLFAALASPTPDAGSMLALAFPMVGLYLLAVGFAWLVDRRRAKKNPYSELSDDEASPLDLGDPFDSGVHAADDAAHTGGDTPGTSTSAGPDTARPDDEPPARSRYEDVL